MIVIEIQPQSNGAHRNQTVNGKMDCPFGWAVIPEGMDVPDTFPFVNIITNNQVVVSMEPGVVPEPSTPAPTAGEQLRADVDYLAAMTGVTL